MKKIKQIGIVSAVVLFWLAVWSFASWRVGKPLLFPSPLAVLKRLGELLATVDFYRITLRSLGNVLSGILLAVVGGSLLAILTAKISFLRTLFLPIMTVIKATPVASFIILAMIWIGASGVPRFITLLIVLPVIWTNLDEGITKIDPQLREVAKIYGFSPAKRLRLLILPSVKPYFVAAMRTSLGLAWKAGIAAEIIAMPKDTIGTMIGTGKLYIETTDVFAWTLTVILLSLIIELLFTALLRRMETSGRRRKEAAA